MKIVGEALLITPRKGFEAALIVAIVLGVAVYHGSRLVPLGVFRGRPRRPGPAPTPSPERAGATAG